MKLTLLICLVFTLAGCTKPIPTTMREAEDAVLEYEREWNNAA